MSGERVGLLSRHKERSGPRLACHLTRESGSGGFFAGALIPGAAISRFATGLGS
jgi:hypothetical protein